MKRPVGAIHCSDCNVCVTKVCVDLPPCWLFVCPRSICSGAFFHIFGALLLHRSAQVFDATYFRCMSDVSAGVGGGVNEHRRFFLLRNVLLVLLGPFLCLCVCVSVCLCVCVCVCSTFLLRSAP